AKVGVGYRSANGCVVSWGLGVLNCGVHAKSAEKCSAENAKRVLRTQRIDCLFFKWHVGRARLAPARLRHDDNEVNDLDMSVPNGGGLHGASRDSSATSESLR